MPDQGTWPGDLYVRGTLRADDFNPPNGTINNGHIASGQIDANKLQQQIAALYTQDHGTAVASKRSVIHVAHGDGTLIQFSAGTVVANVGAATITVDLRKNGTTVLSGTADLDNTVAAFDSELGTFASTTYNASDVFEVVVTATAGGGTLGQGLFVKLLAREDADS